MSIITGIDRVIRKIGATYRKAVFRRNIKCPHKKFLLVGEITLINKNITIGENVTIYPDVMFWGDGPIRIGNNVDIGAGTVIYASSSGGVTIDDNTVIAAQCYIIDCDHGIKKDVLISRQENSVEAVHIGEDVWIAAGCKILKGSKINDGAVIGAASLVKGEIPENAVAVGIPAKVKKHREG